MQSSESVRLNLEDKGVRRALQAMNRVDVGILLFYVACWLLFIIVAPEFSSWLVFLSLPHCFLVYILFRLLQHERGSNLSSLLLTWATFCLSCDAVNSMVWIVCWVRYLLGDCDCIFHFCQAPILAFLLLLTSTFFAFFDLFLICFIYFWRRTTRGLQRNQ